MKIFLAGATGVLGRVLVPRLVSEGHEVVGMTRSASKQELVRSLGARPVVADALDADGVAQAVTSAELEVIVHELTAFRSDVHEGRAASRARQGRDHDQPPAHRRNRPSPGRRPRRGRTALRGAEVRGFPVRSYGRAGTDRAGSPRHQRVRGRAAGTDGDPLPGAAVTTIAWGEGLVLRYGGFYGPGTGISVAPDAQIAAPIRKRLFPIIGGGGVSSHGHIDDAAPATAAAVDHGQPGISYIVDDDPTPVREWLRCSRPRWAPSHRDASRAGSGGYWPARLPPS